MRKGIILLAVLLLFFAGGCEKKSEQKDPPPTATVEKNAVKYWTCGMHPSVRVTDEEYKKGKKNCPICNMPLTPAGEKENETQQTQQTQIIKEEAYYECGIEE